ncbi:MAG: ATP-binding protein [Pseudomonadota bacterium]
MARSVVWLLLLVSLAGHVRAQESCFPAWQPIWPQSAPERATGRAFARDSLGFTWVGGNVGLFRINGQGVSAWYPQPDQPTALPAGHVEALWIAPDDQVWAGTAAGLARLNPTTGLFEALPLRDDGGPEPEVYALHAHGDVLLIGTNLGLAAFDTQALRLLRPVQADPRTAPRIYGIATHADRGYLATTQGLEIVAAEGNYATDAQATAALPDLFRDAFLEVVAGPDKKLYAGTRRGLVVFDPETPEAARVFDSRSLPGLFGGPVRALAFDDSERLWLGGDSGLSRWVPGAVAASACRLTPADGPARTPAVAYLWSKPTGELWVGTNSNDGSVRARLPGAGIERLLPDDRVAPGLKGTITYPTLEADGHLWIATGAGLFRETEPGSRQFSVWRPEVFAGQVVYAGIVGPAGQTWIGGPLGLYVDNGDTLERLTWWRNAGPARPGEPPIYAVLAHERRIWIAGAAGVAEIDPESRRVLTLYSGAETILAPEGAETVFTPSVRPWTVAPGPDGRILVAGEAGVLVIDPARRTVVGATQFDSGEQGYPGSAATAVAALGNRVYVGDDSGVFVTDVALTYWERLALPYASASRASRAIVADERNGRLWFATLGGLLRYEPEDRRWQLYNQVDGLHLDAVNEGALAVAPTGQVLLGAETGVSILDPRQVEPVTPVAPVLLGATVDDAPVDLRTAAGLRMVPGQRRIELQFGSPDAWIEQSTALVFQLQGYDARERTQPAVQPVLYEGLQPGRYKLTVRYDSPQRGSSAAWSLPIAVAPAWWQSWWAWVLGVLALAAAVAAIVRIRVQQLTVEARLVAAERERIARELHDRHLQELVGALMISRRLRGKLDEPKLHAQTEEVVRLLERSSSSARATIRMLAPPDDSRALVEQIRFHADCAGSAYGIPVLVDQQGDPFRLTDQQRRFAVRIVNEAVMNALKHARSPQVDVAIQWLSDRLRVSVVDEGVGIPAKGTHAPAAVPAEQGAATEPTGLGLGNMQQLARAIGAQLTIEDNRPEAGQARGTRVTLRVSRPPLWSSARWRVAPQPAATP